MSLQLRAAAKSQFYVLSLGECMVRLAPPGHGRIEFAKVLEVDVGGGEFNVAYAAARLGLRAWFVIKLPDNPVARIASTTPAPPASMCPTSCWKNLTASGVRPGLG